MRISLELRCSKIFVGQMDIFNRNKVIGLCLVLAILSGCDVTDIQHDSNNNNLNDFTAMVEDVEIKMYEDIVADYTSLSLDEMEQMLQLPGDDQQKYFYFGRTTCLYCRKFILENAKPIESVPNFYYINTELLSDSEKSGLTKYRIDLIPTILTGTNLENIEQVDIDVFVDQINN